ncbi:hypothetical protein CEXT_346771 [Caerostris extrusa]|uniref:Secreted protein n=1 Tax=Caerostris extrusa TaxID=172846 RepID=A0AAV4XXK3_CAEEX|nr:hypothetical protein CEXT_346771 [Caerostris extrusa]
MSPYSLSVRQSSSVLVVIVFLLVLHVPWEHVQTCAVITGARMYLNHALLVVLWKKRKRRRYPPFQRGVFLPLWKALLTHRRDLLSKCRQSKNAGFSDQPIKKFNQWFFTSCHQKGIIGKSQKPAYFFKNRTTSI